MVFQKGNFEYKIYLKKNEKKIAEFEDLFKQANAS